MLYTARGSRPDLAFAANFLGRRVTKWTTVCDDLLIHAIGYLKYTASTSICCVPAPDNSDKIMIYCDSDHAGDHDSRKSTSGYVMMLQIRGQRYAVSWGCRSQNATALSSTEAEICAVCAALRATIPLIHIVKAIAGKDLELEMLIDSEAAIAAIERSSSKKLAYLPKTQGVSLAWIADAIDATNIRLRHVRTADNIADLLTKPLAAPCMSALLKICGVQITIS
eukprot:Lankesteria_metandrocarpae@DN5444_c0_g1_i12.p1